MFLAVTVLFFVIVVFGMVFTELFYLNGKITKKRRKNMIAGCIAALIPSTFFVWLSLFPVMDMYNNGDEAVVESLEIYEYGDITEYKVTYYNPYLDGHLTTKIFNDQEQKIVLNIQDTKPIITMKQLYTRETANLYVPSSSLFETAEGEKTLKVSFDLPSNVVTRK